MGAEALRIQMPEPRMRQDTGLNIAGSAGNGNTPQDGGLPSTHESAENPFRGEVAVVTGASRSIGQGIAEFLVDQGAVVIGGYLRHTQVLFANRMVEASQEKEGMLDMVQADIATAEGRQLFLDRSLQNANGKPIKYLFLNAATGGGGKMAPEDVKKLNVDAQIELLNLFVPHMAKGGKVFYTQSEPGRRAKEEGYEIDERYKDVAATKNEAAEHILSREDLRTKGIDVYIVVANMVAGTSIHKLAARSAPDEVAKAAALSPTGELPTIGDVVEAHANMVRGNASSGTTIFLGLPQPQA